MCWCFGVLIVLGLVVIALVCWYALTLRKEKYADLGWGFRLEEHPLAPNCFKLTWPLIQSRQTSQPHETKKACDTARKAFQASIAEARA